MSFGKCACCFLRDRQTHERISTLQAKIKLFKCEVKGPIPHDFDPEPTCHVLVAIWQQIAPSITVLPVPPVINSFRVYYRLLHLYLDTVAY
jgi:hypothetical protein